MPFMHIMNEKNAYVRHMNKTRAFCQSTTLQEK